MIHLQLLQRRPDSEELELLADLAVDGREERLTGPRSDLIDFGQKVMSVSQHRPITFHEDPEEWARSLIGSFRSPDLFVNVIHDDAPYTPTRVADVTLHEPVFDVAGH
jgi:hypothetical protein